MPNQRDVIYWSLIGVLAAIFQPFETHCAAVVAFIVSLFIYASSLLAELALGPNNRNHVILSRCSLIFGALPPILLALIMVPTFGWLALAIWLFVFVMVSYYSYPEIKLGFHDAVTEIKRVKDSVMNDNATEQQPNGMRDADQQQHLQLPVQLPNGMQDADQQQHP